MNKEEIFLSPRVNDYLIAIKEKLVNQQESRLNETLSMEPIDILKHGISTADAPFELAGRLARKGWMSLGFSKNSGQWTAWEYWGSSKIVTQAEIESMLTAEE